MLTKKYFILNEKGISEINFDEALLADKNPESLYLVDFKISNRESVIEELSDLKVPSTVLEKFTKPSDNIRFNYFGDTLYGEIATFSRVTRKSYYSGIIIKKNVFIGVHNNTVDVLKNLEHFIHSLSVAEKEKISPEGLLFSLVHEILSNYGKLILEFRDGIEEITLHLDEKHKTLNLQKLLTSKSQLSDLSRVLERTFYTLSFPPSKDVLDLKSSYRESFDYLLRITTLLNTSIEQTEDRLESLNDHYQLLLQNKANKRLNFLTIVQSIFVPLTLVVGIYGMNFRYMPELEYHYGYFISLVGMLLFVLISIFFFYKNGWFKD